MKTNDADWVEDVRRWYFNGGRPVPSSDSRTVSTRPETTVAELGYEAAHPSLQPAGWSKPAASGFGTLG